ncbi:GPR1/FUN34/yaaH family-domain-containing protein [Phakopsora pachyrhizi]|uniref:GPR1/FUN34/yaaH family-domain-containing protein n=1 Tax=Phakopsora pachyrhizi TaxID=170000 RepID=A0AAV0AS65_PHAPC|nr:GPR1/FUN34/yaaH family-domain-containing protein [Phakopsora pachyrhizi]
MSNSKILEPSEALGNRHTLTMDDSNVSDNQQYYRSKRPKFADPAPLGLCSIAASTFLLSLINLQFRGVKTNNIVLSMAFGFGGIVQFLAGMWEFASGNTFCATVFSAYGWFLHLSSISLSCPPVLPLYTFHRLSFELRRLLFMYN